MKFIVLTLSLGERCAVRLDNIDSVSVLPGMTTCYVVMKDDPSRTQFEVVESFEHVLAQLRSA